MRSEMQGRRAALTPLRRSAPTAGAAGQAPPIVYEALHSPGRPLDSATRSFMGPRFGRDFGRVRVHTDDWASESARVLSARAFTVGRDIVFAAGEYAPHTAAGRTLLAHELTHVVQQSSAGIGVPAVLRIGPRGDCSEREASSVADQVGQGQAAVALSHTPVQRVQRAYVEEDAAGCGVCEDPAATGTRAHSIAQLAFHGYPSVTTETPYYSPDDMPNGRLDLLRRVKSPTPPYETLVEIGEIKPYNARGVKLGHKDLAFYRRQIEAEQVRLGVPRSSVLVGPLELPPPRAPLEYLDPASKCGSQALVLDGPFDGLYLYSCTPPRSTYPRRQCCEENERERPPLAPPITVRPHEEKHDKEPKTERPLDGPTPVPTREHPEVPQPTAFSRSGKERLERKLIKYGVPAALVTAVIALVVVVIVDPEPISKLAAAIAALLGISAAAATALAVFIVREARAQGGA